MAIATINPATGQTLKTFDEMSEADVERRLADAATAAATYRLTSFADRAGWMNNAADLLDKEQDQVAAMMTTEMGKTLAAARQEVAKCAGACRYYAEHAAGLLADEPADAGAVGAANAYVSYQPLGPVLAIMPWNFPLWQAMRFAVPALMAGNVGLLKHASNVPQTALFIQDLFARAGFPPGTFQTLLIGSSRVEPVLRDRRVMAATLTGSGPAGSSVAAIAGSEVKKVVLELGGSDPFIVMPSADLAAAARVGTFARLLNNGQSCINAKRFIVHDAVYDSSSGCSPSRCPPRPSAIRCWTPPTWARWPPSSSATTWSTSWPTRWPRGPRCCAAAPLRKVPASTTRRPCWPRSRPRCACTTRRSSARWPASTGSRTSTRRSSSPTAPSSGSAPTRGPATTPNGAASSRDLAAGMVFVNGNVTSYPQLPFGGIKSSGHGRELSYQGIREFCNVKSVWIGA